MTHLIEIIGTLTMAAPPAEGEQPSVWAMLGWFPILILLFYFLMIRPQVKREKEVKTMLEAIKVGDRVVTSSGIHGKVTRIENGIFTIEIAQNVRVDFERSAVASVRNKKDKEKEAESGKS